MSIKSISILAAVAVAVGLLAYPKIKQGKAGAPGQSKGPSAQGKGGGAGPGGPGAAALPVAARVLQAERMENSLSSSGNILANEEVEIRSELQGKIARIAFKEGARVKKGDLLVKIDDAELQARVLQAQSGRKLAEDNEFRMRKQLEIEAVSQKDYDAALNELNRAKAEVQLLRAQLEKTELRAPFGGVVGLKQVSEGAYVSPSTLITTLQEIDPVKIDFSIPGKYAGWVKPGQAVTFFVQGSGERHQGKVYAVDPRIDPATRTLRLRAASPNPRGAILPGAFATVNIPLESVESALMVPAQAVSVDARGAKVFVYQDGKAVPRPVQAGLRTDTSVQIVGGLSAGDTVIVSGAVSIRPGSPVTLSSID
jgi:membrane fusion protein (multidrug efflux system)